MNIRISSLALSAIGWTLAECTVSHWLFQTSADQIIRSVGAAWMIVVIASLIALPSTNGHRKDGP